MKRRAGSEFDRIIGINIFIRGVGYDTLKDDSSRAELDSICEGIKVGSQIDSINWKKTLYFPTSRRGIGRVGRVLNAIHYNGERCFCWKKVNIANGENILSCAKSQGKKITDSLELGCREGWLRVAAQ